MIHVHAKTEAAGGVADQRGKGKSTSHLKTASRGWYYKARLALAEKGDIHVDRAQFQRVLAVTAFKVPTD